MTQIIANILPSSSARSQAELAYDLLVEKITKLELQPGQLLFDRELMTQLGVGRTPIREALQRLSAEGLVVHFPHRGMAVSEITSAGTRDIYEFRSLIDGEAAKLAAKRASQDQIDVLLQISDSLSTAAGGADTTEYVDLDREFYRLLGEACGNSHLAQTLPKVFNLHLRLWFYISKMKGSFQMMARAHSEMVSDMTEAIAQREPDAAELAVRSYILQRQKDMRTLV